MVSSASICLIIRLYIQHCLKMTGHILKTHKWHDNPCLPQKPDKNCSAFRKTQSNWCVFTLWAGTIMVWSEPGGGMKIVLALRYTSRCCAIRVWDGSMVRCSRVIHHLTGWTVGHAGHISGSTGAWICRFCCFRRILNTRNISVF